MCNVVSGVEFNVNCGQVLTLISNWLHLYDSPVWNGFKQLDKLVRSAEENLPKWKDFFETIHVPRAASFTTALVANISSIDHEHGQAEPKLSPLPAHKVIPRFRAGKGKLANGTLQGGAR